MTETAQQAFDRLANYPKSAERKAYLAGPMRGYPDLNYPTFGRAAKDLRNQGWSVFSPHEHEQPGNGPGFTAMQQFAVDPPEEEKPLSEYMVFDLPAVAEAEAIVLLPGWEESHGATLEATVARSLDKLILSYPDLDAVANPPLITIPREQTPIEGGSWIGLDDEPAPLRLSDEAAHPLAQAHRQQCLNIIELSARKQQTYGSDANPFQNVYDAAADIDIEPWQWAYASGREAGLRIRNYIAGRTTVMDGEKLRDIFLDNANWAIIALTLWEAEQE